MTYPTPSNLTGMYDLSTYVNSITSGWFWSFILLALFFTIFFALKQYTMQRAYATASFIVWLIALLMFVMGLISLSIFILCTLAGGLGIVGLIAQNRQQGF